MKGIRIYCYMFILMNKDGKVNYKASFQSFSEPSKFN